MTNEHEKFEKLFKESKTQLYNVAYTVMKNADLAEDVLQEAYCKAWRKFSGYDPKRKFTNWMTTIVRNTAIDKRRKNAKLEKTFSIENNTHNWQSEKCPTKDYIDKSCDLVKMSETNELMQLLFKEIEKLPEALKNVMYDYSTGQSYQEIAENNNIELPAARSRIHRAKNILKKSSIMKNYMTM